MSSRNIGLNAFALNVWQGLTEALNILRAETLRN